MNLKFILKEFFGIILFPRLLNMKRNCTLIDVLNFT